MSDKESKNPFERIITLVLLGICIALAVAIYFRVGKSNETQIPFAQANATDIPTETNVYVMEASIGDYVDTIILSGDVTALSSSVSVYPEIGGTITQILCKRGDEVKKGDVLAYVDPSKPGERYKESAILSPMDGRIENIAVTIGSTVNTNTSILSIQEKERLVVEVSIPEKYVYSLQLGSEATVTASASSGKSYEGYVSYIDPKLNASTRTIGTEISFYDEEGEIKEGMYLDVELCVNKVEDVITVPKDSISSYAGKLVVYVVEDSKAVRREVSVSTSNSKECIIESGLKEGDLVITEGSVTDGTVVKIV